MTRSAPRDPEAFVRTQTTVATTPLLAPLALHLATAPIDIFEAATAAGFARPYWAFAWPGGQALARLILDQPALVAGKRVLDVGAGSGLGAIAALRSGAVAAEANDTDPAACAAAELNAQLNSVRLDVSCADVLGATPDTDLVLIGDLVYEPALAARVETFLRQAIRRSAVILFADRTTVAPPLPGVMLVEYEAPLTPAMEPGFVERGRVWRLA